MKEKVGCATQPSQDPKNRAIAPAQPEASTERIRLWQFLTPCRRCSSGHTTASRKAVLLSRCRCHDPGGEVLVRFFASPINPSDLMFIRGLYGFKKPLPAVPGFEGSGTVVEAGAGMM